MAPVDGGATACGGEGPLRITLMRSPGPRQVEEVRLSMPLGATVADALARCGWHGGDEGHAGPQAPPSVGVWGKPCTLDRPLSDLDRVEVYRGLRVDPKEARRERHARACHQLNCRCAGTPSRAGIGAVRSPG